MKRVVFRLSMPNNNSWDGKWSGSGRNYTITKNLSENTIKFLELEKGEQKWYHNFGDGWTACITARIVSKGERLPKSAGFCGYNWMVTNILCYNQTTRE